MRKAIIALFVSLPFAVGCVDTSAPEPEASTAISPLEAAATPPAAEPDNVCRPPVNGRCTTGCCLEINRTTVPPTLSCYDCI